jgi:hypothetical protein
MLLTHDRMSGMRYGFIANFFVGNFIYALFVLKVGVLKNLYTSVMVFVISLLQIYMFFNLVPYNISDIKIVILLMFLISAFSWFFVNKLDSLIIKHD